MRGGTIFTFRGLVCMPRPSLTRVPGSSLMGHPCPAGCICNCSCTIFPCHNPIGKKLRLYSVLLQLVEKKYIAKASSMQLQSQQFSALVCPCLPLCRRGWPAEAGKCTAALAAIPSIRVRAPVPRKRPTRFAIPIPQHVQLVIAFFTREG
jgi:hypothetical protein